MGDFLPICLSDHFYHDVISSCSVMGDCAGCFHSLNYCVISLIPCRLSKYRASFKLNRSLKWFVRLVLRFDGRDFRSNGAGNTSKIALNRASFSLFKTLNVYNHLKVTSYCLFAFACYLINFSFLFFSFLLASSSYWNAKPPRSLFRNFGVNSSFQ